MADKGFIFKFKNCFIDFLSKHNTLLCELELMAVLHKMSFRS